jgi:hypothetical protein
LIDFKIGTAIKIPLQWNVESGFCSFESDGFKEMVLKNNVLKLIVLYDSGLEFHVIIWYLYDIYIILKLANQFHLCFGNSHLVECHPGAPHPKQNCVLQLRHVTWSQALSLAKTFLHFGHLVSPATFSN